MKELSTEQKAKRYDEAIKKANELLYVSDKDSLQHKTVEHIFPELKENEDERIRKAIIHKLTSSEPLSIDLQTAISWLDRQYEQKPAEWNIFDYRTWQYIVADVLTKKDGIGQYLDSGECKKIAKYMQEEWSKKLSVEQMPKELLKSEDYGVDGLYHAISILEKTFGEVEGYQSDDGILEHKIAIDTLKALYNQKPAWSEEDESYLNTTIAYLKDAKEFKKTAENCINWLKSLKPQNKWKPSEEQMEALNAINVTGCISYSGQGQKLINLFNDLKKLREE